MAMKLPDNLQKLADKYNIASDEMWLVPGGKVYAIKHTAIERIAAVERIRFEPPKVLEGDGQGRTVALMGVAQLNDRIEWSIGEASPHNNKNAYPWAIAEKRLKGRLTLKLVAAYGHVYSEEEADDFRQPAYDPPGDPPPAGEVHPQTRYAKHVKEGLSQVPSKIKPAGWADAVAIIEKSKDYADLQYQTKLPHFVNTTSAWSNYFLLKLSLEHYLPKVAEFRDLETAQEMEKKIRAKYPLERMPEAAE